MNEVLKTLVSQISNNTLTVLDAHSGTYSNDDNELQWILGNSKAVLLHKLFVSYDSGADLYNVRYWVISRRTYIVQYDMRLVCDVENLNATMLQIVRDRDA